MSIDTTGLARIKRAFENYFEGFNLPFPDPSASSPGLLQESGWNIRYVFGREGDRGYLELYAMHRMTNDRHLRIYDDGRVQTLETVSEGVSFNPDIPGDRDRAERARKEHDDRLISELKRNGLW